MLSDVLFIQKVLNEKNYCAILTKKLIVERVFFFNLAKIEITNLVIQVKITYHVILK
jgi:hypothetical protein